MVRRYEDPVEVRPSPDGDRPASFLWRGRLYVVREVLGHWQERRAWWASAAARAVHGEGPGPDGATTDGATTDRATTSSATTSSATTSSAATSSGTDEAARGQEREVWRVEASRGRMHGSGVFDLCRDAVGSGGCEPGARGDAWRLMSVVD